MAYRDVDEGLCVDTQTRYMFKTALGINRAQLPKLLA